MPQNLTGDENPPGGYLGPQKKTVGPPKTLKSKKNFQKIFFSGFFLGGNQKPRLGEIFDVEKNNKKKNPKTHPTQNFQGAWDAFKEKTFFLTQKNPLL